MFVSFYAWGITSSDKTGLRNSHQAMTAKELESGLARAPIRDVRIR